MIFYPKRKRREVYTCTECDGFELEKRYSGMAGTPGEEEYDRIRPPEKCPACHSPVSMEVLKKR